MKHILSLEIPTVSNPEILWIKDISSYSDSLKFTCASLMIVPPGFNTPSKIDVGKNFNLSITACNLGIQTMDCCEYRSDIPDGVYVIRYSVAPVDKVFVEYNHLRVTKTLKKYFDAVRELFVDSCDPQACEMKKLEELRVIRSMIDAAKTYTEDCHDAERGVQLLSYANSKLDKILNKNQCH